jgi:ABC-type Mn2+/Zn2+ transport system ATPase subunit
MERGTKGSWDAKGTQPVVALEGVTVKYSSALAIEDVTLSFRLGEMVLIIGPNGGGKTTVLRAITGLVKPVRGRVSLLGRDPLKDPSIRRTVSYVPQLKELNIHAPLTVWDLVEMGRYSRIGLLQGLGARDRAAVERAIEAVGLEDKAGVRISELSGGQLQRAIIARALAQDAKVYLLDEPFESVDQPTEELLISVLKGVKEQGALVLLTEHHLSSRVTSFDRVVLMNRRLVAEGGPKEVLKDKHLQAAYGVKLQMMAE